MKKDIRKLSESELKEVIVSLGEKPFKAKQIFEWIWVKSCTSFAEMTNISKPLRAKLEEGYDFFPVQIKDFQKSNDKTIKYGISTHDQHIIESVLIPVQGRVTACVSSQVGCSLTCKFCATGYMDRARNLEAAEIYDQIVLMNKESEKYFGQPLTNVVYMGMGEPLLNYKNVLQSIEYVTSEKGLNMSPRRITVSTAGVAKMIDKLTADDVKFRLALSLHAANDEKRNSIMPINESNSLEVLKKSLMEFCDQTKSRITLEYIVFHKVNDQIQDAKELFDFVKGIHCKVNIIEYNPIENADFKNAKKDNIDAFAEFLGKKGVEVNIRRSRGKDIDAACGQLAGKRKSA